MQTKDKCYTKLKDPQGRFLGQHMHTKKTLIWYQTLYAERSVWVQLTKRVRFHKGVVQKIDDRYITRIHLAEFVTWCFNLREACSNTLKTCNAKIVQKIVCSRYVRESETVLDSTFHAVDSRFQVQDFWFFKWNLDFGFQTLLGFRNPWAVFRIPKPRIPDSTAKMWWIPDPTKSKPFSDSRIRGESLHPCSTVSTFNATLLG